MREYLFYIVLSIAVILYVLKLVLEKQQLEKYLLTLLVISVLHGLLTCLEIGTPLALLYGPLIYLVSSSSAKEKIKFHKIFLHFSPFLIFTLFYITMLYGIAITASWSKYLLYYYPFYFAAMFLSLLIYPFAVYFAEKRISILKRDTKETMLITQLSTICVLNAVFVLLFGVDIFIGIKFGFNISLMIYALQLTSSALILIYIYRRRYDVIISDKRRITRLEEKNVDLRRESVTQPVWQRYQRSSLGEQKLEEYAGKVKQIFSESKMYLHSGISLDILSKETDIPKHHFSQLFNVYIGKSFYQLIAEYRINYALKRINEESNITIEALAYECGFSSKTSFNKYFKEITGYSPSEYRSLQENVYEAAVC